MGNDGLEALAALASAAPAPSNTHQGSSKVQNGIDPPKSPSHRDSSKECDGSKRGSVSSSATAPHSGSLPQPSSPRLPSLSASTLPEGMTTQQLEQLLAAAAAASSNNHAAAAAAPTTSYGVTPSHIAFLQGLQQQRSQQHDSTTMMAIQQLAYYQYLSQAQSLQQQGLQLSSNLNGSGMFDAAKAAQLLAGVQQNQLSGSPHQIDLNVSSRQQIIPSGNSSTVTSNTVASTNSVTSPPTTTGKIQMPPPPPPLGDGAVPSAAVMLDSDLTKSKKHLTHSPGSTAGRSTTTISDSCPLAPHPGGVTTSSGGDDNSGSYEYHLEGKKLQKRAANRRSAQLSRKRKKQFMEDLKEENDDLRRKEQILKSIPDLILVFDSTGKLWFVSKSVSRLLSYRADELEGTSIWDRMCEDSVRLLKAAFMDSLAARQPDSETAPLGSGFWELRLVDKDGGHKIVTLNGVVHFAGERPECVCSIRPREDVVMKKKSSASSGQKGKTASEMQSGDDDDDEDDEDESDEKEDDDHHRSLIRVKPQQSVICADRHMLKRASGGKGRDAVRISDSGNSSGESESASGSGSSDELNGTSGSS